MKNILTLIALLFTLVGSAQEIFPYKRPQLLMGKEVTIEPLSDYTLKIDEGYLHFFSDEECYKVYEKITAVASKPEALSGRTFKVTGVTPKVVYGNTFYIIKLEDVAGKTVYYKYNFEKSSEYYFIVTGGLTVPSDFYCDYVTEEKDSSGVPIYLSQKSYGVTFMKFKGTINSSVLKLEIPEKRGPMAKGVTILLENNKKIVKPAQVIDPHTRFPGRYQTSVILTKADIDLLKVNGIVSFTMLGRTEEVEPYTTQQIKDTIGCIITK